MSKLYYLFKIRISIRTYYWISRVTFRSNFIPQKVQLVFHTDDSSRRNEVQDFLNRWEDEHQEVAIRTSGSTGKPKIIKVLKSHMRNSAHATNTFFKLEQGSGYAHCLSMQTIAGMMMLIRAHIYNGELHVYDVSSNPFSHKSSGADLIALVPLQLDRILNTSPQALTKFKYILVGGGVISNQTEEQLQKQGITVYQSFGMTETLSHIALRKVGLYGNDYYEAIPGCAFHVEDGALVITATHLDIDRLKTNDLVELIDPQHFKWIARNDFVINSGGVKIHPEVLENKLSMLAPLRYFIFGENDSQFGQIVCLAIEGQIPKAQISKLFQKLDKYEVPRKILLIDQFIQTESGKIDRLQTINQLKEEGFASIL